jgi:site-specific DNA-methyltransferase (adenine-specific)
LRNNAPKWSSAVLPTAAEVAKLPLSFHVASSLDLRIFEGMLQVASVIEDLPATIRLFHGDSRDMSRLENESVHLVVTSPPYWTLKAYNDHPDQLGHIEDYESFLDELDKVWRECFRILVPGGRVVCVVGDVCLARKKHGRHLVMPLHSDITVRCRKIGFDNLNPIIWLKISNAAFEANTSSKFLGKPYEPNAIIKNDMEFILMQRKPGGYRQPTERQRDLSRLPKEEFREWCQQTWSLTGASTREHPAPFPLELAQRLVRMFSFVDDTVVDPFAGTGTTLLAAAQLGRNSVGFEVDPKYFQIAKRKLEEAQQDFYRKITFEAGK